MKATRPVSWLTPARKDFEGFPEGFRGSGGGVPNGIRTRVLALKGPRPGPLDDGDRRGKPYKLNMLVSCA